MINLLVGFVAGWVALIVFIAWQVGFLHLFVPPWWLPEPDWFDVDEL